MLLFPFKSLASRDTAEAERKKERGRQREKMREKKWEREGNRERGERMRG